MNKQTSIQFLFNELWENPKDKFQWRSILSKAEEMHKQETDANYSQQEISDEEIFKQSIKEMEERYGSGCDEEIDAHFRGAIWYREQLKSK